VVGATEKIQGHNTAKHFGVEECPGPPNRPCTLVAPAFTVARLDLGLRHCPLTFLPL
jgi:hypothetical protein